MRKLFVIAAVSSFLLALPAAAHGHIFWSAYDSGKSKVGRADLDGHNVNEKLVEDIYFGQGVATDGKYVYWGENGSNPKLAQIGRATVDGAEPNHAFQQGATYCGIFDIAATATDLFWLKSDCTGLEYGWDIDRTKVSGGGGEYTEVGSGSYVCGFDVDANYVYWAEKHFIARAPLPGPTLPDREWLDVGAKVAPCAVAVDEGHVYWTTLLGEPTYRGTNIGRASIDGSEASVQNAFITGAAFTNTSGLDVSGDFIYWVNAPPVGKLDGYIGRATRSDGSGVAHFFIGPIYNPGSLDVDSGGAPAPPPGDKGTGAPPVFHYVPPLIGYVSSSNGSWAPGGSSSSGRFRASLSKSVPRGTVFTYGLDQDAAMIVDIKRVKAGRLVGKKCKKPTKANAKKKKCDLAVGKHRLTGNGKAGRNELPYSGNVRGVKLKPGKHVAVFTATSPGGISKSASVGFKIVRP